MKDKISLGTMHPFKGFENLYFYEQQQGRAAKLMDISTFLNVKPIKESSFKRILQEMKLEVVILLKFLFLPNRKTVDDSFSLIRIIHLNPYLIECCNKK